MKKSLTALIIMDGFGVSNSTVGNAIFDAGTPNIDALKAEYPYTLINASGMAVGLPRGQMGNSEVGHQNLGAGRVVMQKFTLISNEILDGGFYKKPVLLDLMKHINEHNSALHIMGLVSDGGVHSHIDHLFAALRMAKEHGVKNTYVHCFMDGRDVPPASGKEFIEQLQAEMDRMQYGKIATVSGRYYAMDRDNRWDRVEKAYNAIAFGEGLYADSATEAMQNSYDMDVTDEFVIPTVILENGQPVAKVNPNDGMFFFNFRPDRARELTRAFIKKDFDAFERKNGYIPVEFVGLAQYDETFTEMKLVYTQAELEALDNVPKGNLLGEYVAKLGKTQLRIAETEKYAHVTFFFNGGVEKSNEGEDRVLVNSPKVATYDLKPEMSAYEVRDRAIEQINSGKYDLMVLNFANCDMVGHTGIPAAAEKAVKTVDECVGDVVRAVLANGGRAIVTADHGNAEQMIYPGTDMPYTAHTTNPVPFILVDPQRKNAKLRQDGCLGNIAPTLLELMGLPKPEEMVCDSMILSE